jgi:hypothetical protein
MHSLNISQLIEKNSLTRLTWNYDNKIINKIKEKFTENQQQLFVANAYCSLKHDTKSEFIIDLENIWRWLGFQRKEHAKTVLVKNFVVDIDYITKSFKKEETESTEAPTESDDKIGTYNKDKIFLTIYAFKKFSLRAGPKKGDEIYDYYIKIEELLQEAVHAESNELKLQLCTGKSDREKIFEEYKNVPPKKIIKKDNDKYVIFLISISGSETIGKYMVEKVISLSEQKRIFHRAKLDFKIPYYISCSNVEMMDIIESAILMKLYKYRTKHDSDIFVTSNINVFTNIFDECLRFYEDVDVAIYPTQSLDDD